jgi:hypothetical protein
LPSTSPSIVVALPFPLPWGSNDLVMAVFISCANFASADLGCSALTLPSSSSDSRLMNGTGLRAVLNRPTLRGLLEPLRDLLEIKEVGVGVDALLLGSSHHGYLMRRRLDLSRCARPSVQFPLW